MQAEPFRGLFIEHDIKVGTYDIDFVNHVSNIAYLYWLEDMRMKLFDKYFPLKNFIDEGKTPVLATTSISYKRAIKLFDKPRGVMWFSEMKHATLKIQAELYVDGQLTTTAEHLGVFIDMATGRAIRMPKLLIDTYNSAHEIVPVLR